MFVLFRRGNYAFIHHSFEFQQARYQDMEHIESACDYLYSILVLSHFENEKDVSEYLTIHDCFQHEKV